MLPKSSEVTAHVRAQHSGDRCCCSGLMQYMLRLLGRDSLKKSRAARPAQDPSLTGDRSGEAQSFGSFTGPASLIEDAQVIWQVERRYGWKWGPPISRARKLTWTQLDGSTYKPHPGIPKHFTARQLASCFEPPIHELQIIGRRRKCTWKVEKGQNTDDSGWQYAMDFQAMAFSWRAEKTALAFVRRRQWRPIFSLGHPGAKSLAIEKAPAMANRFATILEEKGFEPGRAIHEADVGWLPLDKFGASLLATDWEGDTHSFPKLLFQSNGFRNVSVGPWTTGDVLQGQVRSLSYVVDVPPAPMCPKETRVESSVHVVVTESCVTLEQVVRSLDVPCGDGFETIICDAFSIEEATGRIRMVRTCGINFMKSTWLKSTIENHVQHLLVAGAKRMASLAAEWASGDTFDHSEVTHSVVAANRAPAVTEVTRAKTAPVVAANTSPAANCVAAKSYPTLLPCRNRVRPGQSAFKATLTSALRGTVR